MEELANLGGDENRVLKQFMCQYDAPAYVRRARQVQEAYDQLVARCQAQRYEWLNLVRIRLGLLWALAGDRRRLLPWLADEQQLEVLAWLHEHVQPRLRAPVEPTKSDRELRTTLRELRDSIERFNRRWRDYLNQVDVSFVNQLREGYNRYFLLEKECAVRSTRVAHLGFRRLEPLTQDEIGRLLPVLPVPQLRG